MQTWIGLFRGINVGGNHPLPMKKLVGYLEDLELENVRTYIQSGNVVFESTSKSCASLRNRITRRIEEEHGFRPELLLLSPADLIGAVESNPFQQAISDPKTLHFLFLAKPAPRPNIEALTAAKASTEQFELTDSVFYLHAPDGIGRSKIAATAEKHLGVAATGRNYRTVEKLLSMIR